VKEEEEEGMEREGVKGQQSRGPLVIVALLSNPGDCEVPEFQSLAICSHCSDVSEWLSYKVEKQWCTPKEQLITHFLPNGLQLKCDF
jgi:hypothetical protein